MSPIKTTAELGNRHTSGEGVVKTTLGEIKKAFGAREHYDSAKDQLTEQEAWKDQLQYMNDDYPVKVRYSFREFENKSPKDNYVKLILEGAECGNYSHGGLKPTFEAFIGFMKTIIG